MRKSVIFETKDSITYWPCYYSGIVLMIWGGVLSAVGLSIAVLLICDDGLPNAWKEVLVFCFPACIYLLTLPWLIMAISSKIEIDHLGIRISNKLKFNELSIVWTDVIEIQFYTSLQFGISYCRIVSKKNARRSRMVTNLTMEIINRNQLERFIPQMIPICIR